MKQAISYRAKTNGLTSSPVDRYARLRPRPANCSSRAVNASSSSCGPAISSSDARGTGPRPKGIQARVEGALPDRGTDAERDLKAGKWYVASSCVVGPDRIAVRGQEVGIDVGIASGPPQRF
jgi:hypothetical protein